jgi:hypothetical protein
MDYSNQMVRRVMNRLTVAAPFSYKSHACIGKFISLQFFLGMKQNCFFSAIGGMGICGDCFRQGNLFFMLPMVRTKLHSQQANVQLFHKYTLSKRLVFDN